MSKTATAAELAAELQTARRAVTESAARLRSIEAAHGRFDWRWRGARWRHFLLEMHLADLHVERRAER